jgi:hypothetical protein
MATTKRPRLSDEERAERRRREQELIEQAVAQPECRLRAIEKRSAGRAERGG